MGGPVDPHEKTKAESIAPGRLNAGAHIGGYALLEVLGQGGMGVVWKAHDPNLDREIAIKVLKRHDAHPSLRKRLLREGRAMARLKHPNVLTVYEVGTEGERDFIAMELVEGGSLDEWIAHAPPREDVVQALLAAGRGLAAAHAAGLVHRDFKPHNVLRSKQGRILVTDFGLARGLGEDSGPGITGSPTPTTTPLTSGADTGLDETLDAVKSTPSTRSGGGSVRTDSVLDSPLTQTGAMIGTPAYMAPEQFRGAAPDPRTDQFAYCITAWQALTGARPHTGNTLDELRRSAERGIGNVQSTLPPPLRAILARGLDPDPDKRWPDLDALLDAFEDIERPRRPKWVIPAGVLGVVALVGITVLMTRQTNNGGAVATKGCDPADQAFADAWSDKLSAQLWTEAQKIDVSADTFARVTEPFTEYRKKWITSYAEACNTTQNAVTAARIDCLLEARDQVSSFAFALRGAPAMVYQTFDPYGVLPNLSGCNGPKPVASPLIPPDKRIRVIAVIAHAFQAMESPRLAESLDRLEKEAIDIGWAPLLPRVLMAGGNAYLRRHDLPSARDMFTRAIDLAGLVKDVKAIAVARLGLLDASNIELQRPSAKRKAGELHPEIASLLTYTKKAITVAGDDPMLVASVAVLEGQAYAALARWSFAKREYKTAFDLVQRARQQWEAAGDVQRAAYASWVEAQLYALRADDHALDDSLFVVRAAEESLDRAKLPRLDLLTEIRAEIAFARGAYSEARALYRMLEHATPPPDGPKRSGIVLDTQGRPVPNATVVAWRGELHGDPQSVATDPREILEEVTTTTDGRFEIHATPDTALIAEFGRSRSLPRLASAGDISLQFRQTRTLTGTIDASNLSGVRVFAKTPLSASSWSVRTAVKSDHSYALGGVPMDTVVMGTEGSSGDGERSVTAGPNATTLRWPTGGAVEVIVHGPLDVDAATVWVYRDSVRGGGTATLTPTRAPAKSGAWPATRADAEARAGRTSDVTVAPLAPIGATATDNGLPLYEPGDHHAVVLGSPGESTVVCVARAAEPSTPVTCDEISVITGAVFDHGDGRVGTDTQPVVINPAP